MDVIYIKLNNVYAKGHFIFYLGRCPFLILIFSEKEIHMVAWYIYATVKHQ